MTDKSNYKLDSQTIHKQFSIRAYEEKIPTENQRCYKLLK